MATEKRLIDANALGIGKAKREAFDNPAYADGWNSAIEIIKNAPTVDAVPVVRCKNCNEWMQKDTATGIPYPYCYCGRNKIFAKPDDFCSYGERITENGC